MQIVAIVNPQFGFRDKCSQTTDSDIEFLFVHDCPSLGKRSGGPQTSRALNGLAKSPMLLEGHIGFLGVLAPNLAILAGLSLGRVLASGQPIPFDQCGVEESFLLGRSQAPVFESGQGSPQERERTFVER